MNKPRKILITGPESTGKSELAVQLGEKYHVPVVLEYAREFLDRLNRPYERADLDEILYGQLHSEERALAEARKTGSPFIICDTGPEVLYIWSLHKYGVVSSAIKKAVYNAFFDLVLLMDIDLPWTPDPQRETPGKSEREQLLERYRQLLTRFDLTYTIISGNGSIRLSRAIDRIDEFA